ncbi:hypothetical protein E2C01_019503 [Portunus trituberculatus]|uniref:Uncharacterized protein n=1 Tax=Portunus trituberculatus TaxID=210409 RepID=A0A5B7DZ09_PORTR|nr:hypothetical protein [Portunus trituberculatus]
MTIAEFRILLKRFLWIYIRTFFCIIIPQADNRWIASCTDSDSFQHSTSTQLLDGSGGIEESEPPTLAKYLIAYFAETVLPAPDSPDTIML